MLLLASFRWARPNSLTGMPSLLACSTSPQPMHRTNLPDASQSVAWRRSRETVTFIAQQALYEIGPETGIVIDRRQTRKTRANPLEHGDFTLPLPVKEIPVRAELVRFHRL